MLEINSSGLWLPNMLQDAISKLEEKAALNFHNIESVSAQASHVSKCFKDLKKINNALFIVCALFLSVGMYPINYAGNMTTGSMSPDWLRDLCDMITMNVRERKLKQDSELVSTLQVVRNES